LMPFNSLLKEQTLQLYTKVMAFALILIGSY
jgi:hypothetical protein